MGFGGFPLELRRGYGSWRSFVSLPTQLGSKVQKKGRAASSFT